jgi:hypothetical protein
MFSFYSTSLPCFIQWTCQCKVVFIFIYFQNVQSNSRVSILGKILYHQVNKPGNKGSQAERGKCDQTIGNSSQLFICDHSLSERSITSASVVSGLTTGQEQNASSRLVCLTGEMYSNQQERNLQVEDVSSSGRADADNDSCGSNLHHHIQLLCSGDDPLKLSAEGISHSILNDTGSLGSGSHGLDFSATPSPVYPVQNSAQVLTDSYLSDYVSVTVHPECVLTGLEPEAECLRKEHFPSVVMLRDILFADGNFCVVLFVLCVAQDDICMCVCGLFHFSFNPLTVYFGLCIRHNGQKENFDALTELF